MSELTQILTQIERGDPTAADQLLPLIYQELRSLAAVKLARERPGQTLQATALVHEAYLRLIGDGEEMKWQSRGHFFSAAAEAMRRILIERYRAKSTQKRGGGLRRLDLREIDLGYEGNSFDLLALDDAVEQLHREDPETASLAKLRIFAGLSVDQSAEALGLSQTTAYRTWTYAQAWLRTRLSAAE